MTTTRALWEEMAASAPRPPLKLVPPAPLESDLLAGALRALALHPRVKWVCRMNSGAMRVKDSNGRQRFVRFHTMPGMSDIIGQMRDGRFIAIEMKRPGEKPTDDQRAFLELVRAGNGVAGVANDAAMAMAIVDAATV